MTTTPHPPAARPLRPGARASLLWMLTLALTLGAPTAWAGGRPGPRPDIVRMPDGTLLHGAIIEFDESVGFTLERVDTGGVVRLRWEHLDAAEVQRIKAARGFTGEEVEPYRVSVVHLVLNNGTTETGVLEESDNDDVYALRRRSGVDEFPRNYVRKVEAGRVEGLAIYGPDELYLRIVEELGTPNTAAEHFGLAVACEGARLYGPAREHYTSAGELDTEFKPELIATRLDRIAVRVEEAAETEWLDSIRRQLYHKQFDEADRLAAEFREDYPTSRQIGELVELERESARRRQEFYARQIVSHYFQFLKRSIEELARTEDITLDDAIELLEDVVHSQIMALLARRYRMDEDLVVALWAERRGGDVRSSSYGTGTFVLGEERALDFYVARRGRDEAAAETIEEPDEDSFESEIEEALRRRREQDAARREGQARSATLDETGLDPEEWWAQAVFDERKGWLTAYYAEFAGELRVTRTRPRDCRLCDAAGFIQVSSEIGELELQTCPTCKELKYERIVSFR